MAHSKVGILLRSYAKSPDVVEEVVYRALLSVGALRPLENTDGQRLFEQLLIVVPKDYDCGKTEESLKAELSMHGLQNVSALSPTGHHSCGALNEGVKYLKNLGIENALILSNKAVSFITPEVVERAERLLAEGAAVVGVSIPGLSDIAEQPVQNTAAFWNIDELMAVGGFDCETGVEEVAPIIRLLQQGKPVVILESAEGELNIRQSADGQARHAEVKNTKRPRQEDEAARLGESLLWVKQNIMHA